MPGLPRVPAAESIRLNARRPDRRSVLRAEPQAAPTRLPFLKANARNLRQRSAYDLLPLLAVCGHDAACGLGYRGGICGRNRRRSKPRQCLRKAFDEMNGTGDGVRVPYQAVSEWLGTQKLDDLKRKLRRGGDVVPPHRHHLRRLRQREARRAAHPLRHHPAHHLGRRVAAAHSRHRAARARAQRLHVRHLSPPGDHQGRAASPRSWSSATRPSCRR